MPTAWIADGHVALTWVRQQRRITTVLVGARSAAEVDLDLAAFAFSPEQMFWGTDITRMPCSWRQCVTMFTEELTWLPEKDKELVMGRALCNWLGWELA